MGETHEQRMKTVVIEDTQDVSGNLELTTFVGPCDGADEG